ncbi:MAG: hypothetical protein PF572_01665 [Patescibacteria group bacterium]|jgi:hypothetical protein|nr:hypothetical protein [Patescibacteria group bacterium]
MQSAACYAIIHLSSSIEQLAYSLIRTMNESPRSFFERVYSILDSKKSDNEFAFFTALNMHMKLEEKLNFLSCIEQDRGVEDKNRVQEYFTLKKNSRIE